MPDPEGVYSSALGLADFSKSFIECPNVRDGNGTLIHPDEYGHKLKSGDVVMINVYMKLSMQTLTYLISYPPTNA